MDNLITLSELQITASISIMIPRYSYNVSCDLSAAQSLGDTRADRQLAAHTGPDWARPIQIGSNLLGTAPVPVGVGVGHSGRCCLALVPSGAGPADRSQETLLEHFAF
jgi:hypothetical protein